MFSRVREFVCFAVVLLSVALLCASGARAQGTADIVGTVTDASGGILPGATVTLTNTGTNISQTTTSTGSGDYTFSLVQVGTYSVSVQAMGFKKFVAPNVAVSAGDRTRVDAKMEVGAVTQTVEVQAAVAPALQTDSSTLNTLVTAQAVQDVPLNGRNFVRLVQLSVGVSEGSPNGTSTGTRPDDRRQTSAFSANGQSEALNNNMIDGMDNNERIIGTIGVRPSIDAIQEVNISTNLYSAENGRTGGGVVNIVTKSGTNSFHGSAYEFFRNKVLNANPTYQFPSNATGGLNPSKPLPNPPFRQNQYGGSLGGPIRKDKTFFFVDYEGFSAATGLSVTGLTVPTLCERGTALLAKEGYTGATSGVGIGCPNNANVIPVKPGNFSDSPAISPPGGGSPCTVANYGTGACPYVDLTSATLDPMGLTMFSLYPLPNGTGLTSNYSAAPTKTQSAKTADMRVDQHFSDKNTFFARYSFNQVDTFIPDAFPTVRIDPATHEPVSSGGVVVHPSAPGSGAALGGAVNAFQGNATERQQSWAASFVHVFRPELLLNLKANYLRSGIQSLGINANSYVSNALGFPCNSVQCVNLPNFLTTSGLAGMNFTNGGNGLTPALTAVGDGAAIPLLQYDSTFQYSAAITWIKNAHTFKFGVALIRRRATINQSIAPHGEWNFSGVYTGEPTGDLLEGLSIGNSSAMTGWRSVSLVSPGLRTWEPSGYVQDDWRAKHWLTLNLGLRYDIFTPYTEKRGRISNYSQTLGLVVSPSIPGSQQVGATDGITTDYRDLAPRFGFAATLKHNTIVRGGFGISFFPTNYSSTYSEKNAPFYVLIPCQTQVNAAGGGTVARCPAPFASAVAANYGPVPSNSSSMVGKTGGVQLAQGLPFPILSVTSVFQPAGCNPGTLPVTAANYPACFSATNNPYLTTSLNNSIPSRFPSAYLEQFNLQVQKEVGSGNVVTLGYVGELGHHLAKGLAINVDTNPTQTQVPLAQQFPWLARTPVVLNSDISNSAYNALQATFVRRFSKGLTVNVGYAWAHALSNSGGACTPTTGNPCYFDNPSNPSNFYIVPWFNKGGVGASGLGQSKGFDWGNTGNDVADRISGSVNYELQFGKSLTGVEGAIVKGWTINGAGAWQTGLPFAVSNPSSANVTNVSGAAAGVADQTCSGRLAHPTLVQWFNPACFHSQTPGTFGNQHPGQLMGPPQRRLDFSMFKEFPVREQIRLQFRAEVFNLLNVVNFGNPNTTLSYTGCSPTTTRCTGLSGPTSYPTGSITTLNSSSTPRQIQFALKLLF